MEREVAGLDTCTADQFFDASEKIYDIFIELLDTNVFRLHRRSEDDAVSERLAIQLETFLHKCFRKFEDKKLVEASFSGSIQVLRIYTHSLPEEFPLHVYEKLVQACIANGSISVSLLMSAMGEYGDLLSFGLCCIKRLLKSKAVTHQQAFPIISAVKMEQVEERAFCVHSGKKKWKKKATVEFSAVWMYFLNTFPSSPLDKTLLKQILAILDGRVIPFLSSPQLLIDFLSTLFSQGGIIGWLSLSSLFTLIRKHRLDYPHFFDQLLTMTTPEMMHSRYRKRFLSLLATFMRSTHISEQHLRSFLKKVAGLSLSAPPSAARWIIPFVYNLLKQHQALLLDMIHDPQATNKKFALYELSVLFNHHIGSISRQSVLFKDRMHRPPFPLDKYLQEGDQYTIPTLLEKELEHKWSRAPPLKSSIPNKLFS